MVTASPKKASPKKATPKASPKKAAPKTAAPTPVKKKAAVEKSAESVERDDVKRWSPLKQVLFEAMSSIGATSKTPKTAEEIAKASKGKLTEDQVRRQLTPKFDLVRFGYVVESKKEGTPGVLYGLTAKGTSKKFE